jgi:hypothetical protein
MIHNGVEYGMMQAIAEGVALLKGKQEFELDVAAIAEMWRHGGVVRSWLLDLTAEFLRADAELAISLRSSPIRARALDCARGVSSWRSGAGHVWRCSCASRARARAITRTDCSP